MEKKEARDLLEEAELNYSQLPGYIKAQAGGVLCPIMECLRVLLDSQGVENGN